MPWSNGLAEWTEGNTAYLSVAFSWRLPDAYQRAVFYKSQGYYVRAGGPGMFAPNLRNYLSNVAEVGGIYDGEPVTKHNPLATFASRGCPVGCYFCIVPKMEGAAFTLFPDFTPRPILCDNNLSALPVEYQNHIIEKYKKYNVDLIDANSGFEPRTFDADTYNRWSAINRGAWRFAYDETSEGDDVRRMMEILRDVPASKKRVYVLIGNEPKEECVRRVNQVIEWGGEPHVQPVMALNALEKKPLVRFDWTARELQNVARWANRFIWRRVPFADYDPQYKLKQTHQTSLF